MVPLFLWKVLGKVAQVAQLLLCCHGQGDYGPWGFLLRSGETRSAESVKCAAGRLQSGERTSYSYHSKRELKVDVFNIEIRLTL